MREKHPKGLAKYLILEMMSEKPRYGYGILEELEDISGGHWDPSYGTVYGTLERLEREGYIERIEGEYEDRKYFELTDEGKSHLEKLREREEEQREKFREMMLGIFNVYRHLCGKNKTERLLEDIREEFRTD